MVRKPWLSRLACAYALFLAGCTQSAQPVTLRSLEASGKFSFLCLGIPDPLDVLPRFFPRDLDDCPDQSLVDGEERRVFSMVTQTTRGEVAMVDLTLASVLDSEPTTPGFNFFPVGAQPVSIVSTPGSLATFVGVAEVGKQGIFALPTSCTGTRPVDAPVRDLTSWPACRLPSAPAEMAMVIDEPADLTQPDLYRQACGEMPSVATPQPAKDATGTTRVCPADLSTEAKHPGRRKLVVSLPDRVDRGRPAPELVVIDAQELLDRPPGEYEPCTFEKQIPLSANVEAVVQDPSDLDLSKGSPANLAHPPPPDKFVPQPSGFAQVDDETTKEHRLYVGDVQAPVIHVLDTSDACNIVEQKPLLPVAFTDPTRIVTTTKLAASPLTVPPLGSTDPNDVTRFLYAIDELDPRAGSVMIFDIGPGSTNRAPLLRPRSQLLPQEPPDRIAFDVPARDVAFGLRDHVEPNPATGSQKIGEFCDPDPAVPLSDPRALYRPAADLSTGAAPSFLRGLFGFVALDNGDVAVIDVQDFDAPCRRPVFANTSKTSVDFRGCVGDSSSAKGFAQNGYQVASVPTVTNEVSCNTVEPNRARSATALRNDITLGNHAPSLRAFPTLVSDTGRTLATNRTSDGLKNPRMLAVDFSSKDKAQVYVGTTLFDARDPANPLVTNPALADQSSLVLPFDEPRNYLPTESFSAVFEGITSVQRPSGVLNLTGSALSLKDTGASFCITGVQDANVAKERAAKNYGVADEDLETFAKFHADHITIKSDLLADTDTYWSDPGSPGLSCGGANPRQPGAGFQLCQTQYGSSTLPNINREFVIQAATSTNLVLESRIGNAAQREAYAKLLYCCFPQEVAYDVRASSEWVVRGSVSGYRHDIKIGSGPELDPQCAIDTDPLKKFLKSRVLEVSCRGANGRSDCAPDASGNGIIGLAGPNDVACVFDAAHPLPRVIDPAGSGCVYQSLWSSFVMYRGNTPSVEDYEFDWTVVGGFSPLLVNISGASDTNTSPSSMVFSHERDGLILADGSSKGLVVIDLSTFAITLNY